MYDYNVAPQEISPLLTRAGAEFERRVEDVAGSIGTVRNLARERQGIDRDVDNDVLLEVAQALRIGETLTLFQPRLRVALDDWDMTGDADIVRFERDESGLLDVLVVDMKATRAAKIEHRLQVAFYRAMLRQLLGAAGVAYRAIDTAILYRGLADQGDAADPVEAARTAAERAAATRLFGVDAQLELTPDPEAYQDAVRDLVTGANSIANQVVTLPFAEIPWHLTYKCDGCLYNEFCMKWAAEQDDLSLLPHLTEQEKRGLQRAGVKTTRELAGLLGPAADSTSGFADLNVLQPLPDTAALAARISCTWPVGPRLHELVHRARRHRSWQGDVIEALPYIPSKGYGSLPYSDPEHNPNLVRVYLDAQHDYLSDRIYLIGSLVVANEGGAPDPHRRRLVVEIADEPPDDDDERALLVRWIDRTIRAIAEVAAPDEEGNATAPIHLIFYNGFEQRLLLEALNRHAKAILGATPLYDFITQLAAFDSPVATFLDREIRELKNYPVVCQSLQAVAAIVRVNGTAFDWNEPEPYRDIFRERMFDALGKFNDVPASEGQRRPWATRRSRFNSQIPLEYAYAAWEALPAPPPSGGDPYGPYRRATIPLLLGFQGRRLEAMEHVASDFAGNIFTTKSNFAIPDLANFRDKAPGLAEALLEFVTIERHVDLAAWKSARLAPPERRVLAGDSLLVRFVAADQALGVAEAYAENRRRAALKESYRQAYLEAHPGATKASYTAEQKQETAPLPLGAPFRLRIETEGTGISVDDALLLSNIKPGDRVIVEPRWTVDSRLPPAEQTPLTPTPKQLLYGMRHVLSDIERSLDDRGRVTRAWLLTTPSDFSMSSGDPPGFLFAGFDAELEDGGLFSIDPDPNDIYGFWIAKVVKGLNAGSRNELFQRVSNGGKGTVAWPEAAAKGQARFMAGLQAMDRAGAGDEFEPSKVELIGEHGDAPLVLVQGPPGTGKSYTTAFAILARLQGALAAGTPFHVLMGAKTHAATDVLLANVIAALDRLRAMSVQQPTIYFEHFDDRLLAAPLYRMQPRGDVPPGVVGLLAGSRRKNTDQGRPFDVIAADPVAIVAATPGAVYTAANDKKGGLFDSEVFELLVLDEASQLSLPESIMAALPLRRDGQVIVVGDHRQMAPIVKHDWENETRRTFQDYAVYRSLFDTIRGCHPRPIQFERSFRLDQDMAEFLRRSVYAQDGLQYYSRRTGRLRHDGNRDDFVAAVLQPDHPLVIVVHDEAASQVRNDFERDLTAPLLTAMHAAGYRVRDGFGLVVPHRAQRANLQQALRSALAGEEDKDEISAAVDTVERFQGGERDAIIVSATESDPAYLLAAGEFLYDPRRLTVAISRAKDKMVLVASRSVFDLFSLDEETFVNAQLWKDLLHRTCTVPLWAGERCGQWVEVWGNPPLVGG